jgi:hypothetical protein
MTELDYLEELSRRRTEYALDNLDRMKDRAYLLLTMLLGGAGGAGGFALGQIGSPYAVWVVAGLGALSVWWFVLAAVLAVAALKTRLVLPSERDGQTLLEHLRGPLADYVVAAKNNGESPRDAFTILRENDLKSARAAATSYRDASEAVGTILDWTYRFLAATPLVIFAVFLVVWRCFA